MIYIWELIQIQEDIINGFISKLNLKIKEILNLIYAILQKNILYIKMEWNLIYFPKNYTIQKNKDGFKEEIKFNIFK